MATRKQSIEKATPFLNECLAKIKELNGQPLDNQFLKELSRKHKVSNSIFYDAVKLGFIARIGRACYLSNIPLFETLHTRKVLKYASDNRAFNRVIAINSGVKKKRKRTHRYLWGLIKIKF